MAASELASRSPPLGPDPPPLRIHHLLIWTTLTAAIISGCMTFDRWARNGPRISNPVIIAGLVLGAVVIAGALTCVGCGFYWRRRGFAFPQSPGDWLLTIISASVVGLCTVYALFLAIFFASRDDDWFAMFYVIIGAAALIGWVYLQYVGMRRRADTGAWRFTFGVLMLSPCAAGQARMFGPVIIAVIACVMWAAWNDWHHSIQRQWTHWCGAIFAISLCTSLLCVFGF